MIPLRDTTASANYPVVNTTIIGVNVVVFLYQLALGGGNEGFIVSYGLVPARYTTPEGWSYFGVTQQIVALFSFMFLHGGFLHLIGNMWSLYIFGDNVEDRLGSVRYVFFYLACGLLSGFAHLFLNLPSRVPTIGASGAIAGVMGAYLILYPRAKILTLIPIFIIPFFFEIPAFFFLGVWFLLQFINAAGSSGSAAGIAWWAHIGGFVGGILLIKLFPTLPHLGATEKIRQVTVKKHTHRLQMIKPTTVGNNADLYGTIEISPYEALLGTHKMVNIPWGFQKRLFRVAVPAGISEGSNLRLKGQGRQQSDGRRGDLYLKVAIKRPVDPDR